MEDMKLPLHYGAFQEPSEGKTGQDMRSCLPALGRGSYDSRDTVFIARKPWACAGPFFVRLADL